MSTIEELRAELEEKQAMLSDIVLLENRNKLRREILALATQIVDYEIIEKYNSKFIYDYFSKFPVQAREKLNN